MHKGELLAISPKGKGKHPDHVTALIKSEVLNSYKDNQKWLIISDAVQAKQIKKGECEFDIDNNKTVIEIKSANAAKTPFIRKKLANHVKAFSDLNIFELEAVLNEFASKNNVFATQVFQTRCDERQLYDALVHYKEKGGIRQ